MYSYEDRITAVRLYIKYGRKTTTVIRELGYPSRKNLIRWVRIYEAGGGLPERSRSKPRYTLEQKRLAVDHYFDHGCCLAQTCRDLGYPSRGYLRSWLDEMRPGTRQVVTSTRDKALFTPEHKRQAVSDLCERQGSAQKVAKKVGVSRPMLYKWKDQTIGHEAYQSMRKLNVIAPDDERAALFETIAQLKQQVHRLQLEQDVMRQATELIKKDQGITALILTNREKTRVVDALRDAHSLPELLYTLQLARSSYFYHKAALSLPDKYAEVRDTLVEIFHDNHRCYGYRRVQAVLRKRHTRLSEKVVRRLMAEAQLVVHQPRRRRYSSYCDGMDAPTHSGTEFAGVEVLNLFT